MMLNKLLSLDEALEQILAVVPIPQSKEQVDLFAALGRVVAEDVLSQVAVPSWDNSAMDGYALRSAEVAQAGAIFPVSQRITAGQVGAPLAVGTVARIFTGAPIPQGADAVVMQENCRPIGVAQSDTAYVAIDMLPQPGLAVRRCGEDIQAGGLVLKQGQRISPPAMGVAASAGWAALPVWVKPRVALITTGNELTMPGKPLSPGGIYNSNRFAICGLLQKAGVDYHDLGVIPDDLAATCAILKEASTKYDLILTTGAVSVGEEDHLKAAVQQEGQLNLWQLAIKPGKPLAFGQVGNALFVGLPGNPVASFVTFLLVVYPLLRKLSGETSLSMQPQLLPADFEWLKPDRYRREFLRVRRNVQQKVALFSHQGSGVLTSVLWADGLVDVDPGQTIHVGDLVKFWSFAEWMQ